MDCRRRRRPPPSAPPPNSPILICMCLSMWCNPHISSQNTSPLTNPISLSAFHPTTPTDQRPLGDGGQPSMPPSLTLPFSAVGAFRTTRNQLRSASGSLRGAGLRGVGRDKEEVLRLSWLRPASTLSGALGFARACRFRCHRMAGKGLPPFALRAPAKREPWRVGGRHSLAVLNYFSLSLCGAWLRGPGSRSARSRLPQLFLRSPFTL